MGRRGLAKRTIGGIYSWAAESVYDRVVVGRAFPLLAKDINELVLEQGRRAVVTAAGRPVLDMPVGTAFFTTEVALAHDGLAVGCDIAEGMVHRAATVAASRGATNLTVVQADAHHLPFPDGAFGAVLCSNGLQVIPGLVPTLTELARVLASDGVLYIAAIALPVGAALPERARLRLPGFLRPAGDVTRVLARLGLNRTFMQRRRLGYLIGASRPAAKIPADRSGLS